MILIQGIWIKTTGDKTRPYINRIHTIHGGVLHVWEKNIHTNEVKLLQGKQSM